MDLATRAQEISDFLGVNIYDVKMRLGEGFHFNHALVAEDFRSANPQDDAALLEWYRSTDAYIYELSAYHLDVGFNYTGMMTGVAERLSVEGKYEALVLGDGIGDLSIFLAQNGCIPTYNDLGKSLTAKFAMHRFEKRGLNIPTFLTHVWKPRFPAEVYDAIIALDFFEHLTEVEYWVRQCHKALCPDGLLMAQNAFAIGDDEHGGSIPMHLTRNNKYEFEWFSLLESVGFTHEINEWWRKT